MPYPKPKNRPTTRAIRPPQKLHPLERRKAERDRLKWWQNNRPPRPI